MQLVRVLPLGADKPATYRMFSISANSDNLVFRHGNNNSTLLGAPATDDRARFNRISIWGGYERNLCITLARV